MKENTLQLTCIIKVIRLHLHHKHKAKVSHFKITIMKVRKSNYWKIKRIIEFACTAYNLILLSVERQKDFSDALKQFDVDIKRDKNKDVKHSL